MRIRGRQLRHDSPFFRLGIPSSERELKEKATLRRRNDAAAEKEG